MKKIVVIIFAVLGFAVEIMASEKSKNNSKELSLKNNETKESAEKKKTSESNEKKCYAIQTLFNSDKTKELVVACDNLIIVDVKTKKESFVIEPIWGVPNVPFLVRGAWSQDDSLIAAAYTSGEIQIFDANILKQKTNFTLPSGFKRWVSAMKFLDNKKLMVSVYKQYTDDETSNETSSIHEIETKELSIKKDESSSSNT